MSGADRTIKSYQDQFAKIQTSFLNQVPLDTAIQVHKIAETVEQIGMVAFVFSIVRPYFEVVY